MQQGAPWNKSYNGIMLNHWDRREYIVLVYTQDTSNTL